MSGESENRKYEVLDESVLMPLNYFTYGQAYTGSGNGKRYRINMGKRELPLQADAPEGAKPPTEKYLTLEMWPEPYAYDVTDPVNITLTEYPFGEEAYERLLSDLDAELKKN